MGVSFGMMHHSFFFLLFESIQIGTYGTCHNVHVDSSSLICLAIWSGRNYLKLRLSDFVDKLNRKFMWFSFTVNLRRVFIFGMSIRGLIFVRVLLLISTVIDGLSFFYFKVLWSLFVVRILFIRNHYSYLEKFRYWGSISLFRTCIVLIMTCWKYSSFSFCIQWFHVMRSIISCLWVYLIAAFTALIFFQALAGR